MKTYQTNGQMNETKKKNNENDFLTKNTKNTDQRQKLKKKKKNGSELNELLMSKT